MNPHNPQKIEDHLADCFFLMNYFLVGYLVFEEKHYKKCKEVFK
jgi:hypothetical protein